MIPSSRARDGLRKDTLSDFRVYWGHHVQAIDPLDVAGRLSAKGNGIVRLEDGSFKSLVTGPDRPYHLFVLFNAKNSRVKCDVCAAFEDEIEVLASSFERQKSKGEAADAPDLFFAVAELKDNREAFNDFQLQHVPVFAYFAPTEHQGHASGPLSVSSVMQSPAMDAEGAAAFVSAKTGWNIEVYRSPWMRIIVTLLVLGSMGAFVYHSFDSLWSWALVLRDIKVLWLLLCLGMYYISISGVLFDIIRGAPMIGMSRTGAPQLISPQSGQQFGIEGLIVGFLHTASGFAVLVLCQWLPRIGKATDRLIIGGLALASFFFFYSQLVTLYRVKSPWYMRM